MTVSSLDLTQDEKKVRSIRKVLGKVILAPSSRQADMTFRAFPFSSVQDVKSHDFLFLSF